MTDEEFSKLPKGIVDVLRRSGYGSKNLDTKAVIPGEKPYTQMGASSLVGEAVDPYMEKHTFGITAPEGRSGNTNRSYAVYAPAKNYTPETFSPSHVRAHEMEHVLANQSLGDLSKLNSMWDKMTDSLHNYKSSRAFVVNRLIEHAPYLQKEWGLDQAAAETGYFSKGVLKRPDKQNFLYEQLASLSALEQAKNKKLTEDPYVRKYILTTPEQRETYDALTGLRQTRLDAKDLPPHTRQPERMKPTFLEMLREGNWFAQGGSVSMPDNYSEGSWKLI
jgi:hypothetical protein